MIRKWLNDIKFVLLGRATFKQFRELDLFLEEVRLLEESRWVEVTDPEELKTLEELCDETNRRTTVEILEQGQERQ